MGDSIVNGITSGTIAQAHSTMLKNALSNDYGLPAHDNAWFGSGDDGQGGAPRQNVDSRFVKGSSWTADYTTYGKVLGGGIWKATTNTNSLAFTPDIAANKVTIYYLQTPSSGSFSIDYNGIGTQVVSCTGTNALRAYNFTAGNGNNTTYNIKWSSGGEVQIAGVVVGQQNRSHVIIANAGVNGSKSADGAGTTYPWSPINAISTISPKLVMANYGTNDRNTGVANATYQANMQAIITAAKAVGDYVGIISQPANPADGTYNKSYAEQKLISICIALFALQIQFRIWIFTKRSKPMKRQIRLAITTIHLFTNQRRATCLSAD